MGVETYSLARDGEAVLSPHFRVREFACKDGSDTILIAEELVTLLQQIRYHFGAAVTITSAYRTPAYNQQVGGVSNSQHTKGTAADIVVSGASPEEVAQYAEYLRPDTCGIGLYTTFTHVDVRTNRSRWDNRSGKQVVVDAFPGYVAAAWYDEYAKFVKENGIADGDRPTDPATRAEVWAMLKRLYDLMKGGT